ncbi:MAG TPA: sigma-54 dependent transcriptional regulator [Gemmatimonadales bacterium]|nr:sigma-54 dependent transcriptional regulator [Gemmatimonadales bacterium]
MSNQPSILVVDDEMGILDVLRILLKGEGFDVTTAQGGKAGLDALRTAAPDIVLTDIKMPGVSGTDILAAVREQDPETPVILMTAQASLQSAIQAVNQGAFYYIQKPFSNDDLIAICRRAAEQRLLKAENKQLKQEIRRRERFGLVKPLGKSRLFSDVLRLAEQVAPTENTVLIQGESGTGKEVIARYIHELSARAEGPFLSLNCGALPESLLESELFGHVKGSFTGAVRDKQGLFAAARGGTFFLDEIGEMSPATQVKLLRVLQEREAIPVGGTEAIPVDVRVVAATNRDLEEDIKRGRFRTDLYYRLNVIAIHLPPLRDRREDIPIFVQAFLDRIAKEPNALQKQLAPEASDAVMAYDWPGNVRELENALERAVVLTKGETIQLAAMPDKLTERRAEPLVSERQHPNPTLDVIERAYITWVLQSEGGNKTRAAEVLGIDPSTLYRKLSRYDGGDEKSESER